MLIQLESSSNGQQPRKLFYSYSHRDEPLRETLEAHLISLKRDGFILDWHDRKIMAGEEWAQKIDENLNSADIILFLVSPFFLASTYCRGIEVKRAMERCKKGEAVVIPVILKACVYSNESFAGLEPLPKTGRPLTEWPDIGFAQVAEDLRVRLLELNYPRHPDPARAGMHGNWILKFRVDNGTPPAKPDDLIAVLKDISKDYSITLEATAKTRIPGGESQVGEIILIMNGSSDGFAAIQKEMNAGRLSAMLGIRVISFYIGYGAVIHNSTRPIDDDEARFLETGDLRLFPGRPVQPCCLKGIKVKDHDPGSYDFVLDRGDRSEEEVIQSGEYAKLLDYFKAALTVREENMWVNLSAYEADRMLPEPLAGTQFGRDILAQDVVLKQLTASFLHPDSPVGIQYWKEVHSRARQLFGTSKAFVNSFHKVWIVPSKAVVYEMPVDDPAPEVRKRFGVKRGERFAYIVETELDTLCECDLVALKHHAETAAGNGVRRGADFTTDLFKEIVLPQIRREVNMGEHFVLLRQIYNSLILATWFKKKLSTVGAFSRIFDSVNNDNPASLNVNIRKVQSLSGGPSFKPTRPRATGTFPGQSPVDHLTPDAPAFRIADNVEFYEKYIRLFRDGVFRCARSEQGDTPGERINRLYFSGAVQFVQIPLEIEYRCDQ